MIKLRFLILTQIFWISCQESAVLVPKPRAYPRIEFPERKYEPFEETSCPFHFEKPVYVTVEQDTSFFNDKPSNPCWFNLYYPAFNCRIHCSYYPIQQGSTLEKLKSDAFNLAMEHNRKATYIDEVKFEKPNAVSGFIFNLEGPVATPFQFYMTDSTNHFLRGALYFNTQIRPDSLGPLYEFVKVDITHLINTFSWK